MGVMFGKSYEVKSYRSDSVYQSVLTCLSPPGDLHHGAAAVLSYKPSSSRPVEALTLHYLPVIQQQVSVFSSKEAETHFYLKTHVPLCVLQSKTQHFLSDLHSLIRLT